LNISKEKKEIFASQSNKELNFHYYLLVLFRN
jgi:hypothetical protein